MTKGLFVKEPWIDLLLSGDKTWEIRGSDTKHRGPLFLIKSGTGQAFGLINLYETQKIPKEDFLKYAEHHKVYNQEVSYKNIWAWKMEKPRIFESPVDIKLKPGAVIFLNLEGTQFKTMKDLYLLSL